MVLVVEHANGLVFLIHAGNPEDRPSAERRPVEAGTGTGTGIGRSRRSRRIRISSRIRRVVSRRVARRRIAGINARGRRRTGARLPRQNQSIVQRDVLLMQEFEVLFFARDRVPVHRVCVSLAEETEVVGVFQLLDARWVPSETSCKSVESRACTPCPDVAVPLRGRGGSAVSSRATR